MLTLASTVELRGGVAMPRLGLGVYRAKRGGPAQRAVEHALRVGYRHVDTAHVYRNEADVGAALASSGVPRDEVFVTTKLGNRDHGYEKAQRALDTSLRTLGLEQVDLYLIHWPMEGKRLDSWRALEKSLADGKCRAIGVSNFEPRHLTELLEVAKVVPAVNQFELHPFLPQPELVAACREHDIVVQAYCPLVRAERFDAPGLVAVAKAVGRTPAQVLVRWSLQKGYVPLPKSVHAERIEENAAVFDFELTEAHMALLDALDDGHRAAWDPTDVP